MSDAVSHPVTASVQPRWLVLAVVAVACWGVWAVLGTAIGEGLTAAQQQALSTVGLLPVMGLLARSGRLSVQGDLRRGIVTGFVSGVLVCLGNVAYYQLLRQGEKVSTVVPLTALYPLVTVALAVVFLRERLHGVQVLGVVLAFVSIYLFNITRWNGVNSQGLLLVLVPVGLWGVAGFLQKISAQHISGELSTQWFLTAFVPMSLLLLVWEPLKTIPGLRSWGIVVGLGLAFGIGNLALLAAYARGGKASVLAPVAGLYPVVSVPLAILFLGERIGVREIIAILIALAAVAFLAWEKNRPFESQV